jgi:hypothetical protein
MNNSCAVETLTPVISCMCKTQSIKLYKSKNAAVVNKEMHVEPNSNVLANQDIQITNISQPSRKLYYIPKSWFA